MQADQGAAERDGGPRQAGAAPLGDALGVLIRRYHSLSPDRRGGMTEQETCTMFVLPMLRALGWDAEFTGGEGERGSGACWCELRTGGAARIVVMVRRPSDGLDAPRRAAPGKGSSCPAQAVDRAWNLRADWAVLTNFEETRLYYALAGTPEEGLVFAVPLVDMPGRLDDLSLLAKESAESGRLGALRLRARRGTVDRQVVDDMGAVRREMRDDMLKGGAAAGSGGEGLLAMAQTLIDRLVVMRIAEDRGLIEAGTLRGDLDRWRRAGLRSSFARHLRMRFGEFEEAYGMDLFRPGPVDGVALSNGVLARAIDRLYAYDFSLIGSDVLGGMYEDYLEASPAGGGRARASAAGGRERRRLGIYYTPAHLVSHILDRTLGRKLAGCRTPEDVSRIRVLDPSCGSGSFLTGAFDFFLEWYREYNRRAAEGGGEATATGGDGPGDGGGAPGGGLEAVEDPGRRILRDNLFGIDIDPRAAGVAALNLTLKAMTRGEKPDEILGTSILVGNALVTGSEAGCEQLDPGERAALRPLDAARLPHDRFDVVVGNPPYYAVRGGDPIRVSEAFEAVRGGGTVNAAMMFIKRSIDLLDGDGGRLGLVIPKACAYARGWSGARGLLFDRVRLTGVVDCREAFRGVDLEQIVVVCEKDKGGARGGDGGSYEAGLAGPDSVQAGGAIGRGVSRDDGMIHVESDPASWSIAEKMRSTGARLGDLLRGDGCLITTGEYMQGLDCWIKDRPKGGLRMLSGDDIARYRISASRYYRRGEKAVESRSAKSRAALAPHVVGQRIVAHIGSPAPHIAMAFAYDEEGSRAFDTVTHIVPGKRIDAHALVAILNSRAVSWYAHRFVFCNAVRGMDMRPWYAERIVVPSPDAGAEKALATLGRTMASLAASRDASRPRLRDYLAERAQGALRLRDYVGDAAACDRRIHDKATVGTASRLEAVDEGGGWLGFFADYSPPRTRIARRRRIVSLRVRDRGIRDYIRAEAGRGGALRPARGATLYEQAADARIGSYGKSAAESAKALGSMLRPYARDAARHDAWRARFAAADAEIDGIVCRAFGLSDADERRINESSRPPGRSRY